MTLGDLLDKVRAYNPAAPLDVDRARLRVLGARCTTASAAQSGEPYLIHPLEVAGIIADLRLDVPSVATGLLHDTVEDTLADARRRSSELFGDEIAALVDGVTKIGQINFTIARGEAGRELPQDAARDGARHPRHPDQARRPHAQHAHARPPAARDASSEIAQETLDIYAPLAHRLGIYWMKSELEDIALRYLHPEVYYQLKRNVAKKKAERERYIDEVIARARASKLERGAASRREVTGRPKHFYSIYQKMQAQNLLYDQIYDLIAFRVLVDSVARVLRGARRRARELEAGARAASRTTSRCRRRTSTSRCTPR